MIDPHNNDTVFAETSASLTGISLDKFTSKQLQFRIPSFLENSQSFVHPLTNIKVSFYLDSNRGSGIKDLYKKELFNSIMTIQKKLPDRVDIFNNNSNEEMSNSFEGLVKKDVEDLSKFLTLEKVNEIINESYNFVD